MYTTHGHIIPGTKYNEVRPTQAARCGGVNICSQCASEAWQVKEAAVHYAESDLECPACGVVSRALIRLDVSDIKPAEKNERTGEVTATITDVVTSVTTQQ